MARCIALVLAGGNGSRFGGQIPKQYELLGKRTVLRHTIEAFKRHPLIDDILVVLRPVDKPLYFKAIEGISILSPVAGGDTRQESTRLGLLSLSDQNPDLVLIHDAARPFPNREVITRTIAALKHYSGAIPAIPITDTVKRAEISGEVIAETIDRSGLWRAQTPQGFRYQDILEAHQNQRGKELTDDSMIAEQNDLSITLIMGHEDNIKITKKSDMLRAERMMEGNRLITRVGMGFDVHSFCPGDHILVGGVRIDHEFGLKGHSDADAALHAITDAILGAISDGDIGTHFPPSDAKWKNADSLIFVKHAASLVRNQGGEISNVDLTIICERPKILHHRESIQSNISNALQIDPSAVGVKATTTEGLGWTGRREGLAAQAVAAIRMPI